MFKDRKDAGKKLAEALKKYKDKKGLLVLGIPRGGVEVGCEIARALHADFSVIVSRKLPMPQDPEAGFGAVAEDGSIFVFENYRDIIPDAAVKKIMRQQRAEIKRRIAVYRKGKPLPEINGRTVILADDGIAMGSTMRTSIKLCRNKNAGKIVVAAPVAGEDIETRMRELADEVVILEKPYDFHAVAQAYLNWYDATDAEVVNLLENGCRG